MTECPRMIAAERPETSIPGRRRLAVWGGWGLVVAILLSGVVGGIVRGLDNRPNWGSLCRETAYVWEQGATHPGTAMFGYLPTATFALWPFTVWLPRPWGLLAYVAVNLAAAGAGLWIAYRWWADRDRTFLVPALLVAPNLQHVIQANQLTLWTLVLCLAGLTLVARRRPIIGGFLLGAAGAIKVLPFMLAGLLVLRRKWAALAGMVLAVVLVDLLPSLVFFGPAGALAEHRAWLRRAQWHSSGRQIEEPLLIGVHRHGSNFSLASVLTHWLRGLPEADTMIALAGDPPPEVVADYRARLQPNEVLLLAPMPPEDRAWGVNRTSLADVPRFSLTRWSARTVRWIWLTIVSVGLGLLAWATWRTGRRGGDRDWTAAGAAWMLAMFFVSPMARHYYLALALPAMVVVWRALRAERARAGRWTPGGMLAASAMVAWIVGLAALGWDLGRWYGLHLGVLAVLLSATAWAWRRGCPEIPSEDGQE